MHSKKEHSAADFRRQEYEGLTVNFVAMELYEEMGRATQKGFRRGDLLFARYSCVVV